MSEHGNSNKNFKTNHLYEIRDSVDDDVFKYGISHDPIEEDGCSNRMRVQVDFLNLGVKWLRFFARILMFDIPGKKEMKRIERAQIRKYREEFGQNPRGIKDDGHPVRRFSIKKTAAPIPGAAAFLPKTMLSKLMENFKKKFFQKKNNQTVRGLKSKTTFALAFEKWALPPAKSQNIAIFCGGKKS